MSLLDYEILSKIGESSYTMVFRVRQITTNSIYALKKIRIGILRPAVQKSLLASVFKLTTLSHPNLLTYRNSFYSNSNSILCLILDLADNGNLHQKITQTKQIFSRFPEPEIWEIMHQILECTRFLHKSKILHRNLQASSVYLFNNGTIKVGDLSFVEIQESRMMDAIRITNIQHSPEVVADKGYSERSDVWGIGCIVYEMAMLRLPFEDSKNLVSNINRILSGKIDMEGWGYSQELRRVMERMLIVSEKNRPGCNDVLKDFMMPREISITSSGSFIRNPRLMAADNNEKDLNRMKSNIQLKKIKKNTNKFEAYAIKRSKIVFSTHLNQQAQEKKTKVSNIKTKITPRLKLLHLK